MSTLTPENPQASSRRLLRALDEAISKLEAVTLAKREPIAVIGMGFRFPGESCDPASFWKLLQAGVDAIRQVPPDRWNADAYYDAGTHGKMSTKEGGFLDEVDQFDAHYFGISPREATSMDPQHRLLLEVAVEALENAGCMPNRAAANRAGVFVGITNTDYMRLLNQSGDIGLVDGYFVTGNVLNAAAGRLSYSLGLVGPSLAVDTACSSSLVALHLACQSLRAGECDLALAGGVNLILSPEASIALSRAQMLSPDGRCKAFDAAANGYGRGEGCGLVVLKRLSTAVKDRDRILAVIRASAVNQDGPSGGFTVPNGISQEAVIRRALDFARLNPGDIDYVEAHGTGTPLGDPIEIGALASALGPGRLAKNPLLVGTVKTNIGHLESAAGIAGLIKVLLALENSELPPLANFKKPNRHIAWDELPIQVVAKSVAWPRSEKVRRAGVSSFGISGTNAYLILEEAPALNRIARERDRDWQVLTLSAKSEKALQELAARFEAHFATNPELSFGDVCFTTNTGRGHHQFRLGASASNLDDAAEMLRSFRTGDAVPGLSVGKFTHEPNVALLFSGESFDHCRIGRSLYDTQPLFRRAFDECAQILHNDLGAGLAEVLVGNAMPGHPNVDTLHHATMFSFEYALARLWIAWGINPLGVIGLDTGEYTAACVAGVLSLEDALKLRVGRAKFRENPIEFERLANQVSYSAQTIRYISASKDAIVPRELAARGGWVYQLNAPTTSCRIVEAIHNLNADVVLTLNPHAGLAVALQADPGIEKTLSFPSIQAGDAGTRSIFETLAALYARGAAVHWEAVHQDGPQRRIPLPTNPWQRQRYWFELAACNVRAPAPIRLSPILEQLLEGEHEQVAADLAGTDGLTDAELTLAPKLLQALVAEHRRQHSASKVKDWLYEVRWQSDPIFHQNVARALSSPCEILKHLSNRSDRWSNHTYSNMLQPVEELSVAFIVRALDEVGWHFVERQRFTLLEVLQNLGIQPRHQKLLNRLFDILQDSGYVAQTATGWETLRKPVFEHSVFDTHSLVAQCPELLPEITLLYRCGSNLAAVLQGRCDPLQLLFPVDHPITAAEVYQDSPAARWMNALIRESVVKAVEQLRESDSLRVLEVGAGTGATTLDLLPVLPRNRTAYQFTDISPGFFAPAKQKFQDYPFVQYKMLDIEKEPVAQGYDLGAYDMIVAANVLHATADVRKAVQHLRSLLAPGGLLILREPTERLRSVDLVFGLVEGWWRFNDFDLRPSHPLLSSARWKKLLEENGFDEVSTTSELNLGDSDPTAKEAVIVARADQTLQSAIVDAPGHWVIFADREGVADRLAALFKGRGDSCTLVREGMHFESFGVGRITVVPDRLSDFQRVFAEVRSNHIKGVLYLWTLDYSAEADATLLVSAVNAEEVGRGFLNTVQALLNANLSHVPSVTVVTRGAMAVTDKAVNTGFVQAGVWGMSRILALEHPEYLPTAIDLDPHPQPDESEAIAAELSEPAREPKVALRNRGRYVAKTCPIHPG